MQVNYKKGDIQCPLQSLLAWSHTCMYHLTAPCLPQLPLNPGRPRNPTPLPHKSNIKPFHLGGVQRERATQYKQRKWTQPTIWHCWITGDGVLRAKKGKLCEIWDGVVAGAKPLVVLVANLLFCLCKHTFFTSCLPDLGRAYMGQENWRRGRGWKESM